MKNKLFTFALILLLAGGVGFILSNTLNNKNDTQANESQNLIPADVITHGHGLSVAVDDPNKLYIATHHGLMVLINDKELFSLSNKKDDYMGFSAHPTNPKILYSSGHPESGGNIGFQQSQDGGFSWKKVSDGIEGPVDFHAMAVSASNPNVVYGWYKGALQRSTDEGRNWRIISTTNFPIVSLVVDPKNENKIYAASPQGLLFSDKAGRDWKTLLNGYVSAIAINPTDSQKIITYSEEQQLAISNNGGINWKKITINLENETPLYISYSMKQPEIIYLLTEKNSIYKSSDGSASWNKIR